MKKESCRLIHVNHTMDGLHGLMSELYESFIDEEKEEMKIVTKKLIRDLKKLSNSLEDEMQDV